MRCKAQLDGRLGWLDRNGSGPTLNNASNYPPNGLYRTPNPNSNPNLVR